MKVVNENCILGIQKLFGSKEETEKITVGCLNQIKYPTHIIKTTNLLKMMLPPFNIKWNMLPTHLPQYTMLNVLAWSLFSIPCQVNVHNSYFDKKWNHQWLVQYYYDPCIMDSYLVLFRNIWRQDKGAWGCPKGYFV